LIVYIPFEFLR